jgi:hypothetical protein
MHVHIYAGILMIIFVYLSRVRTKRKSPFPEGLGDFCISRLGHCCTCVEQVGS